MILLTVGTQLPFDRLVSAIDQLAPELPEQVVGQVGKTRYVCKNIEAHADLSPLQFQKYIQECSVIVAHAGIGTLLNARKYDKPIILVPRRAVYGEHRNDHQVATCRSLQGRDGIAIVEDPQMLSVNDLKNIITSIPAAKNKSVDRSLVEFIRGQI